MSIQKFCNFQIMKLLVLIMLAISETVKTKYNASSPILSESISLTPEELNFIELNRYDGATVTDVKKSSTQEYSADFWFFANFYNDKTRDAYFSTFNVIWDQHLKMEIKLGLNENNENQLNMNCYIAYNSALPNSDASRISKEGYLGIPENSWTHLQCGVRLNEDNGNSKLFFTNKGKDTFTLENYKLDNKGTTSLTISNTSRSNLGIIMINNLKLWETFAIENMNLDECSIKIPSSYNALIHYFTAEYDRSVTNQFLTLRDAHDSTNILRAKLAQKSDFSGYGIFNNSEVDFSFNNFRTCLNFAIEPYTKLGQNNVTKFNFKCIGESTDPTKVTTSLSYSILSDKDNRTIIPNTNGIAKDYVFSISESAGICKDKEQIEVYCIAHYNSLGNSGIIVTDIASETIFLDREVSSAESKAKIADLINKLETNYDSQIYSDTLSALNSEIIGDGVECNSLTNTCSIGVAVNEGEACVCKCPCGTALGNLCITDQEAQELRDALDIAYLKFLDNLDNESTNSEKRNLQVSSSFDSKDLTDFYNLISSSISVQNVTYVNENYLDLVDNLLYNPTQDNIVNLIASDFDTFMKILNALYSFYNNKLKQDQNEILYKYLETNNEPRLNFDVYFVKNNSTGSYTRNYTSIITFKDIPEYYDSEYIMSVSFTDALIEKRNSLIKDSASSIDFSAYVKFFDRINTYLINVGNFAITNNSEYFNKTAASLISGGSTDSLTEEQENELWAYSYTSSYFIFNLQRIKKDFDFSTLKARYPYRSYFDASDYLQDFDSNYFYFYYFTYTELPENYYFTFTPITSIIDYRLYNGQKVRLSATSKNVKLFLSMSPTISVKQYIYDNLEKYSNDTLDYDTIVDIIRQPYYVDEDGYIFHNWTTIDRIDKYFATYRIYVNLNTTLFDYLDKKYLYAHSIYSGRFYATAEPDNTVFEDYDNDYFWNRTEILKNQTNYEENPSFYIIILHAFFFLLIIAFFLITRVVVTENKDDYENHLEEIKYLEGKIALNDKSSFRSTSNYNTYSNVNAVDYNKTESK